jgi:ATP-dependent DNA helicase RecG
VSRVAPRNATKPPAPVGPDTHLARSGLVPPAMARKLGRLGLETVRDLLFHLPRRYDDFSRPTSLAALREEPPEEPVSARVTVASIEAQPTFRRRVQKTVARLHDEAGDEAEAVWFGRRFIERRLRPGDTVLLSGKVQVRGWMPVFQNPDFGPADAGALHAGRIVPVYRLTEGVTLPWLRRAMRGALDAVGRDYREYLPAELRRGPDGGPLPSIGEALEQAHYPEDFAANRRALDRLGADELLALQVGMVSRDRQRRREAGAVVPVEDGRLHEAVAGVEDVIGAAVRRRLLASAEPERRAEAEGFVAHLTDDQRAAVEAVRTDLASSRPMLRLLQGDVGSGKTAVAALALAFAADAGHQGALLAPTDLLARQHAATLRALLEPLGHGVTILSGSLPAAQRRAALEALGSPQPRSIDGLTQGLVVVGTHALVQEAVGFHDLVLAVVDEQHRFGVAQREALGAKGRAPHILLMTATPIPRTLGQVLHADLDVSDLRTPPAGRQAIATGVRRTDQLLRMGGDPTKGAYPLLVQEVASGHRGFVVVPLVEEDEQGTARSAEATAERLRELLPRLAAEIGAETQIVVDVVHGQMRPADRDAVMERFRAGDVQVLVGTTVLEVGVDVPEATVMIVLDADRFGVAQLHQLRGRVGRGEARSYAVLVSDSDDPVAIERLKAVSTTEDGFVLAEKDLELRSEGELLGLSQSGLPTLRVASLRGEGAQAASRRARDLAERLIDDEGRLRPGHEALAAELERGWLARVGAGEVLAAGEGGPAATVGA